MTDKLLYFAARVLVAVLQALPLSWVAQVGRCGGGIAFWLDAKHRHVALRNLTLCYDGVKSPAEIHSLARENFRRIGENFCCSIKAAALTEPQLRKVLEVRGVQPSDQSANGLPAENRVYATGHFGNFELFARVAAFVPGYRCAATYRGLRQPSVERLVHSLRTVSGNLMFERRTGGEALKKAMDQGGLLVVLFSDQSTRDTGIELPFMGHPCFTTRAPAVLAARYHCSLYVPICYRTAPGRWLIDIGEPIPTQQGGSRRPTADITRDINAALEAAVSRDPANWFWVHNRWKKRAPAKTEAPAEVLSPSN